MMKNIKGKLDGLSQCSTWSAGSNNCTYWNCSCGCLTLPGFCCCSSRCCQEEDEAAVKECSLCRVPYQEDEGSGQSRQRACGLATTIGGRGYIRSLCTPGGMKMFLSV